jgi:hypothetical protein
MGSPRREWTIAGVITAGTLVRLAEIGTRQAEEIIRAVRDGTLGVAVRLRAADAHQCQPNEITHRH